MNILDLPATIHLEKYGADNQQCSSERKISSVLVFKQDPQKTSECFTVIKNSIKNTMSKTGISQ